MTIHEIVAAASELRISYGEYVNRYEPKPPPKVHIPKRVCKQCGREIGPRYGNARFCLECADDRRTEAFAMYDIKRKERRRADDEGGAATIPRSVRGNRTAQA